MRIQKKKIYLKIPLGDKNYNKNKYWLLKKVLYGLKQAGRKWYKEISYFFISIGFIKYNTDKCLFGKYDKSNKFIYLLTLYIDIILITGKENEINYVINK